MIQQAVKVTQLYKTFTRSPYNNKMHNINELVNVQAVQFRLKLATIATGGQPVNV